MGYCTLVEVGFSVRAAYFSLPVCLHSHTHTQTYLLCYSNLQHNAYIYFTCISFQPHLMSAKSNTPYSDSVTERVQCFGLFPKTGTSRNISLARPLFHFWQEHPRFTNDLLKEEPRQTQFFSVCSLTSTASRIFLWDGQPSKSW